MRKRHAARPGLESMEDRLTLSALGATAPTAEVHVTRLNRLEAHKAQVAAAHATKHDAATTHHATAKHAKAKSSSTSSSFSSAVSSFFKDLL
jgi:hypothetical protein